MAGVSKPSLPSAPLECKEWTITVPGITDHMFTETQKIELVDISNRGVKPITDYPLKGKTYVRGILKVKAFLISDLTKNNMEMITNNHTLSHTTIK